VSDELDILRASLLSGELHELHITRASQWTDADQHPITRAEWESFAEAHLKLSHQGTGSPSWCYMPECGDECMGAGFDSRVSVG
jgi:hypothetical protein